MTESYIFNSPPTAAPKVLIFDQHEKLRDALAGMISERLHCHPLLAATDAEAYAHLVWEPDVRLAVIDIPHVSKLDPEAMLAGRAIERCVAGAPLVPLILTTSHPDVFQHAENIGINVLYKGNADIPSAIRAYVNSIHDAQNIQIIHSTFANMTRLADRLLVRRDQASIVAPASQFIPVSAEVAETNSRGRIFLEKAKRRFLPRGAASRLHR